MAVEIKLPDLGEGVEDATISRWLVKEGDEVKEGDIILEIATDKVDTEVPAPAAGKLLKVNFSEGELAPVSAVLGVIGAEGESAPEQPADSGAQAQAETEQPEAGQSEEAQAEPQAAKPTESDAESEQKAAEPVASISENGAAVKASPVAKRVAADKGISLDSVSGTGPGGRVTKDDVLASADGGKSKAVEALPGDLADVPPLSVRRVAALYNVDLAEIAGGKPLSALTRYDVMNAVAEREGGQAVEARFLAPREAPKPAAPEKAAAPEPAKKAAESAKAEPAKAAAPAEKADEAKSGEELVKHSRMRQAVARTVTQSAFLAPHVTTMWDVNMAAVLEHRKAHKNEFAQSGVNLTVTAYLIAAIVDGLRAVPAANATYTDEGVIVKRYYNIGMAVALPQDKYGMGGLIVPVIKHVEDLNLMGIARAVNDYAEKARAGQLKADDLQDGTFTLSNYGTSGSRFQTPIIVQPQVGILGVGAIEKRPVVVSQGHPLEANTGDYMAFLPMTTLGFSYDHRVLDGATADAFCAAVKKALEEKWT
jgi:2-oxoglutarate dehydrogenase E2 component (dihydrolipoamide succinyltransferase)